MLFNYYKYLWRNLIKNKVYHLIKTFSLTIGLTAFILILVYISYELSFDRFHKNQKDIYRVMVNSPEYYMGRNKVAVTPPLLAIAIKDKIPEAFKTTRIYNQRVIIEHNQELFSEDRFLCTDPEFLEMFSFPLIQGDINRVLREPYNLLLTQKMAQKYFGTEDPIGQSLQIDNIRFTIEGILKNPPLNSNIQFNFLTSFSTLISIKGKDKVLNWYNMSYYTYVQLYPNADYTLLGDKLNLLPEKNETLDIKPDMFLQPLVDSRLYTKANFEMVASTDPQLLFMLSAIGLFILILAVFNYINLSTARATQRAKEIGLRKVVGASKTSLIRQFLVESMIFVVIALLLSMLLVCVLLPIFGQFLNQPLNIEMLLDLKIISAIIITTAFTGLLSGTYPAFLLSDFRPTSILKGERQGLLKGGFFRNLLVVMQFIVSFSLIFCSLTVSKQLNYLRKKNMGYTTEAVIGISYYNQKGTLLKSELSQNSNILDMTLSSHLPISITNASFPAWEGSGEQRKLFYRLEVDDNFFDFYEIPLLQGNNFSETSSSEESYIVNQTASKIVSMEGSPIGKQFEFSKHDNIETGIITGVVRDFNFASLRLNIEPVAIGLINNRNRIRSSGWLSLKVNQANLNETLNYIETRWKEFFPDRIFSITFLDERIERMYRNERKTNIAFTVFTIIAVIIAALGLFGLASFDTERRIKEIGIRKVFGAETKSLVVLLLYSFTKLVGIAILLALPISYYFMTNWLDNFAYQTNLGWELFALTIGISILISFVTVIYLSFKAANKNPVEVLCYE